MTELKALMPKLADSETKKYKKMSKLLICESAALNTSQAFLLNVYNCLHVLYFNIREFLNSTPLCSY